MRLNGTRSSSPRYPFVQIVIFWSSSGHSFIDILKIDIEGAEFDTLTSFVEAHANGDLPIGQLQLEIHAYDHHKDLQYFLKWWETLEAAGLRPFSLEPNLLHVLICRPPEVVEVRSFFRVSENV